MIRSCIRHGCRSTFESLSAGQIFSLEKRPSGSTEFFWLCAECEPAFAVVVSPDGEVDVVPRESRSQWLPPNPQADLRPFPIRFRRHVAA